MALNTLTELDTDFTQRPGARVVSVLPLQPGGVDPLGLRQINLRLMDLALPGINNVTTLVRPYVLMAWAWWKAAQIQTKDNKDVPFDALRGIVERIETIFVWSHILAGHSEGLPGKNILGRSLPGIKDHKSYSFSGKIWEKLRKDRRANTSLMAAVQYGPSIRTRQGLGWLDPKATGALVPVDDVMDAVNAFDAIVAPHLPSMLTRFDGGPLTSKAAAKLYRIWTTAKPTIKEQEVFRKIFFSRGEAASPGSPAFRRHATLQLIFTVIGAANKPINTSTIRRMMCSGRKPNKSPIKIAPTLLQAQRCWISLPARQLLRAGPEALLVWIENYIKEAGGTADAPTLSAEANRLASENISTAVARRIRTFRSGITALANPYGWSAAAGMGGKPDIFDLMDKIVLAQEEGYDQIPSLALNAIAIAAEITGALSSLGETGGPDGVLGGAPGRLPLEFVVKRLDTLDDEPMQTLWDEIIERWVLGQHVQWSVARSGDETQRLRVAVDEGGWVRLRSKLSGPFRPTPDRLAAALALSANCGLLKRTKDEDPLYALA